MAEQSFEHIRIDDALDAMLETGFAHMPQAIGETALTAILEECRAIDNWRPDLGDRGNGHHRVIKPYPRNFLERRLYAPKPTSLVVELGAHLESEVQIYGMEKNLPLLASWDADHIIVNRMEPKSGEDGALFMHRDPPRYSGLVAVLSTSFATLVVEEKEHKTGPGDIELLIADDLATYSRVTQPVHAVSTNQDRISIFYGHDTEPPQTMRRIVTTRLASRKEY